MSTQLAEVPQARQGGTRKPRIIHIQDAPGVALCGTKIRNDHCSSSSQTEQCVVCLDLVTNGRFQFR